MPIDRSKVDWDVNARALEPQPKLTVGLYDTTLRDGEQTVGVVLSPDDKLAIATALEAGVDRIEAGFPRVSEDDWRSIELIVEAGLEAEIWGFSRAVPADVEALIELGLKASVIESPSDAKLEALGVSRQTMIDRIRAAVSLAAENGIRVAFFGVDSSRADLTFAKQAYASAVEAGAAEIVVVDTLGIATPEAAAYLVGEIADRVGSEVPVHWHGHDDFGLATAAVAAVQAGASWAGNRERHGGEGGNADLLEVALALEALYAFRRGSASNASASWPSWWSVSPGRRSPRGSRSPGRTCSRESRAPWRRFHDLPAIEPYAGARRRGAGIVSEEERDRLHPHQAHRARARLPGGSPGGAPRCRQAARRQEARPRDRREFRRIVNRKRGSSRTS